MGHVFVFLTKASYSNLIYPDNICQPNIVEFRPCVITILKYFIANVVCYQLQSGCGFKIGGMNDNILSMAIDVHSSCMCILHHIALSAAGPCHAQYYMFVHCAIMFIIIFNLLLNSIYNNF